MKLYKFKVISWTESNRKKKFSVSKQALKAMIFLNYHNLFI